MPNLRAEQAPAKTRQIGCLFSIQVGHLFEHVETTVLNVAVRDKGLKRCTHLAAMNMT